MARVVLGGLAGLVLAACGGEEAEVDPGATVTVTETVTASPTVTNAPTPVEPSITESPSAPAGLPRTYAEAEALFDAYGQEPLPLRRFATPDGDIYCVLSDKLMVPACEIGEGAVEDHAVCGDAPSHLVGRIELRDGRAEPICNLDSIRSDMPDTLEPGTIAALDGVQCLNAGEQGVVCLQPATGAGFALRAGEYALLAR